MAKKIQHGEIARKLAVEALADIAEVIAATVGPAGRPILLSRNVSATNSTVFHTKDGISVLRELSYIDPVYDAVHRLAMQATADTMMNAGDGPQPLWSKVLTPNGFVEMKDVHVGMEICGTNGTRQTVLGVFPKGEKEIYEVEFSNKRVVECCADHLWTVVSIGNKRPTQTKPTKELQRDYVSHKPNGHKVSKYYTPRTFVEFNENKDELRLDPYLVGVLLGDGSLSGTGSIEMTLGDKKVHIIDKIKLPEGFSLTVTHVDAKNAYRVKIKGENSKGETIHDVVRSIGLLGVMSGTKFIPKSYLHSSVETRTNLLQGLIDTDGHINSKGAIEFSTISDALARDFVELAHSLGKAVTFRVHHKKEGDGSYSMKPIHRVRIGAGWKDGNRVERITATGKTTQMQCIKVSNPDNLYITDNYIVTHNTSSTLVMSAIFAKLLHEYKAGNPQEAIRLFRKEIDNAVDAIQREVVFGDACDRSVALTSTNGDVELTDVVLKALEGVSAFGTVIAEKNPMSKQKYSIDKEFGYQAGGGYGYNLSFGISVSDIAVTNGDFYLDDVYVVPFNGNLVQMGQILPVINGMSDLVRANKPVNMLIVSYEVSDDVCGHLLALNRQNPLVKVFVSKTTPTAEMNGSWNQLNDIAAFAGSTIVDAGSVGSWNRSLAGMVKKVRVGLHKTFISGRGENNWIAKRAEQNEQSAEMAPTPIDREIINSRNASLTGGLVKLTIGGGLPGDLEEISARADDAIRAVQACRRSGALPGCGLSYIRAAALANCSPEVSQALSAVHRRIMDNFGIPCLAEVNAGETVAIVGDRIERGNFVELGVADSFETVKSVITNGFALGSLVANLGGFCINADIEEIQKGKLLKELMAGG